MIKDRDIALIKGMLARGDRQSDIAAWFGGDINGGRISEINTGHSAVGQRAKSIKPANQKDLPPSGPYKVSGRAIAKALSTLTSIQSQITDAIEVIESFHADD